MEKLDALNELEEMELQEEQTEQEKKKLRRKVIKRNVTIVVLIIIIIILLLRSCSGDGDSAEPAVVKPIQQPTLQTGVVIEDEVPIEERCAEEKRIKIPVIQDFSVSSERPHVTLFNPEGNAGRYLLKYDFTNVDTGEVIYSSDWLEGGFSYSVDMYSCLKGSGEYNAVVIVSTKDAVTYEDKNGAVTQLVITATN